MPKVLEVPVPAASSLFHALKMVHFCDAYKAPLSKPQSVQEAYEAVFGHAPKWVNTLMAMRGVVASALGLKHEVQGEFKRVPGDIQVVPSQIGQRMGSFFGQSIKPNELIVGSNDTHLDFRISIYKSSSLGVETVTVSTAVEIHNAVGKIYMFLVKPFHRFIARAMLQRAVDAGRL